MPAAPAAVALSLVALTVVSACVWAWLIAAAKTALTRGWLPEPWAAGLEALLRSARLSPRLPLVQWSPRQPAVWGFIDLIILLGVWVLASLAVSTALHAMGLIDGAGEIEKLSLGEREAVIAGNIAVSLFILVIGLPLIAFRSGAGAADLGWSWSTALADLRLGLIGFVMLAPPVYALQGLLIYFWQPSKHPLMEMFKGTPDGSFFALLLVSAAVVAPLLEELLFRVVLQGFLEKAFSFRGPLQELFLGGQGVGDLGRGTGGWGLGAGGSEIGNQGLGIGDAFSPSPEPRAPSPDSDIIVAEFANDEPRPLAGAAAWLPIAISSAVFALLHYSHGPDWVPLFLLAVGMGYLYQRTHRLLPSLTVHALLNSLSMWGLWVQVHEGLGTGG